MIFVATFTDKIKTRMSVHCEPDVLDVGRGVRLAKIAYESRTKLPAPALVEAHFEDRDGRKLMTYDADALNDPALMVRKTKRDADKAR